jgi:GNAT superfamily N-acetyltransferase
MTSCVRHAALTDVPRILFLLRRFHAAGDFDFTFDAPRMEQFAKASIAGANTGCFVVGDPVAGVLIAHQGESFAGFRFAEELLVWVEPDARGSSWQDLLDAFETWARAGGCSRIKLSAQQSLRPAAMARLYRRSGYQPCETVFIKEI